MKSRILVFLLTYCYVQFFYFGEVMGQQCTGCSSNKTYNGKSSGTVTNGTSNWTPSGKINDGNSIPRFDGTNATYHWEENDLRIGGVVLANGANLSLDRGNAGNNPGFSIQGGCIIIGSGSTLSLVYITELRDVTICVEEGGSLVLDSREETRNDFTLTGVEINLQGPNSEIVIGDADFIIGPGGVSITGWTGDASNLCPSTTSGVAGSSGNISWTTDSDGTEICKILNANSACGPAGCDVIVNGNTITGTIQDGSTICIKGNRGYSIDLQNKDDLTICVPAGISLSGLFTNYSASKRITVNVYGTVTGNLTLNNSASSFNIFSGGQYNNYGTLTVQNGSASNQGTVTNSINLSTNSTYFNSGTHSGQLTLNNTSSYTNTGITSNTVTLNNTSSYINSGEHSGNVILMNPNSKYSILPTGTHTAGFINVNNGLMLNQGVVGAQVTTAGAGEYRNEGSQNNQVFLAGNSTFNNLGNTNANVSLIGTSNYSNTGTQSGNLVINNGTTVTNSGTLNLSSLNFDTNNSGMVFNNTSSSILNVTNSSNMSGTITLNGTSTFSNNLTLTTNNGTTSVLMDGSATLNVLGTLDLASNSNFNLENSSSTSPQPTVTVGNLEFANNGGSIVRELNIGANTNFDVLNVANLQSGLSQLNIEGNFATGINNSNPNSNTLIVGNNGSGTPTRIQLSGEGSLNVTGSASISKHISAEDNSTIEISGNLILENNGDNSFSIQEDVSLIVEGNTILNKPMYVSGSAYVNLNGDLTLPNVSSELVINDDVNFYVAGNTSVESPIRMNDNAYVTFIGNVDLPNVGNAIIVTNDNADVLITSNLTKSGGSIDVNGVSQLVICDQRRPSGTISGSFPEQDIPSIRVGASPAYYGGCRILPVEFLSFNATYQAQTRSALLDWSTAKEWQNSHFEIERAVNSVKEWETIGSVEGNGYSDGPMEYNFTDTELPLAGRNIFYRLKQVDFSGKFSYSRTRAIQVDAIGGKSVWVAYPNPSSSGSEVSLDLLQETLFSDEVISVQLSNMLGESESTLINSPENISEIVSDWLLSKKAGLYILDIRWGTNSQQIKLLRN